MNENQLVNKSIDLVKEAMKDVKAEFLIVLEDGSSHIVYITKFEIVDNKIIYECCTPSKDRTEELSPHIENIFKKMMESMSEPDPNDTKLLSF